MKGRALNLIDQSRSEQPAADRRLIAAVVGQKVLDGLDKGRQRAITQAKERAAFHVAKVVIHANVDVAAGKPERGRAGRISRKLSGILSERQVKRILDRLSCMSDSAEQNGRNFTGGHQ